ncbi:response regulator [Saliphagus sp. GCM10025308]
MTENDSTPFILLVEDNPGDVQLTQIAFQDAGFDVSIQVAMDGVEAIEFLEDEEAPCPDLILLDLNLPRKNGFDVLEEIKSDSELRQLPVIVLTSSASSDDVILSYEQHANAYLTKPTNPGSFVDLIQSTGEFWIEKARMPSYS